MWKTIQSAFPKPPAALPVINGKSLFEDKAAALHCHFFPPPPVAPPHQPSTELTGFTSVTHDEIKAAIAAIPASSAPGDDTLTMTVWKNLHIVRPDYLTAMTDWSLRSRTLPALLKQVLAVVFPKPTNLITQFRRHTE
ncbi:hypothetical protein PCASD_24249 [Puccinia coronata f. sp. avenae]|uniref:Uncharacterized protein n=1 Tax=Puccinia coronata f. sp. avenae TaxID=200324 RepID=A0A2N5THP5_9BASI|nr:hypothetical protein PCASD_24249 [Puccinia coronata f. sp. avenae]